MQQQAHLAELGEHQRLLAGIDQVGDQLVETGQLARPAAEARPVAECMRRMVADLLQPGQRGQDQTAPAHARGLLGIGQQLVDDALVHAGLLAGQRCPRQLLDLVGQVGHQRLVGLGSPKQERRRQLTQRLGCGEIVVAFDRDREAMAELVEVAEQAGRHHRHDRPQLAETVLDWRAGEGDVLLGRAAIATPWPCASPGS